MKDLYVVKSGNVFGQILIFERRDDAVEWLHSATNWNEQKIDSSIYLARQRQVENHEYATAFLDL